MRIIQRNCTTENYRENTLSFKMSMWIDSLVTFSRLTRRAFELKHDIKRGKISFYTMCFVRPHKRFAWSFMTSVLSSEIEQKDRGRKTGGRHNLVSFRKGLHKKNRYLKISTFTVTAC